MKGDGGANTSLGTPVSVQQEAERKRREESRRVLWLQGIGHSIQACDQQQKIDGACTAIDGVWTIAPGVCTAAALNACNAPAQGGRVEERNDTRSSDSNDTSSNSNFPGRSRRNQ